jgi:hypothetical protein
MQKLLAVLGMCGVLASAQTRVYISDSESWEVSGGFAANNRNASGAFAGGSRPQTVELIKTFGERCPAVTVSMDREKADYVVLFDREGGKGVARKHDKIAVFKKDGDVLYSGSTRNLGNAVKDACAAIGGVSQE